MIIGTGCASVDRSLQGGFKTGEVSLVYGDVGVGKTTLALQCALDAILKGFKVFYVYTDGRMDSRQIERVGAENLEGFRENFSLFEPRDFDEQEQLIYTLEKAPLNRFKLVVFDTVTSLYRLSLAKDSSITLSKRLNQQLAILAWLALNSDLCVLVTSRVRLFLGGEEPPAISILEHWAKTMVKIEKVGIKSHRRVGVEKLSGEPCSSVVEVELTRSGFR